MARDEHTTNRPTPGGSAFQGTVMSNRIPAAKAVPAASYETSETRGKLPAVPGIVLRTIIASAPRPEPVAAQVAAPDAQTVASAIRQRILSLPRFSFLSPAGGGVRRVPDRAGNWIEWAAAAALCELESVDAMLAAAPEAPQPVLDRPASIGGTTFGVGIPVRTLVAAAQRRYEAEQTPASQAERQALIDALRRPVVDAELTTLREQNATLGEAISLQHANGEALAERVMQAEAQNAALVAAIKAIDNLTGSAGFEFGGPLAVAINEGLGDRAELLELAGIAGGYFEAISKHTENALASAKGGAA